MRRLVIGIDFDNTIANYDDVMYAIAVERGLLEARVKRHKRAIRDSIRQLANGETEWQRVQAVAYGPRMAEARLAEGVSAFLARCREYQAKIYVISHKTEYARLDETRTNLRVAALRWMDQNGFFGADGFGLVREQVYFEPTRGEKVKRIAYLRCTHFIDDLEETFLDASFPIDVERILYTPQPVGVPAGSVRLLGGWREIGEYLFDGRD